MSNEQDKSRKAAELCNQDAVTVFNPDAKTLGKMDDKIAAMQAVKEDAVDVFMAKTEKKLRDTQDTLNTAYDKLNTSSRDARAKVQEIGNKLAKDLTADDRKKNLAAAQVFKSDITEKDLFRIGNGGISWTYSKHTDTFRVTLQMDIRIRHEGVELVVEFTELQDEAEAGKFKEFVAAQVKADKLSADLEEVNKQLKEVRNALNDKEYIRGQAKGAIASSIIEEVAPDAAEKLANLDIFSNLNAIAQIADTSAE